MSPRKKKLARRDTRSISNHRDEITFCIMTMERIPYLRRCIFSIREFCSTPYTIKLLSQGQPPRELIDFLHSLNDERIELIVSDTNLGFGGGRRLLTSLVKSPFTMILDDDAYLTQNLVSNGLAVLKKNSRIGAVGMPEYDLQGRMLSAGADIIEIRNSVIHKHRVIADARADWIEVNSLGACCMLYKTEMNRAFSWDPGAADFEDLDKSLQIISNGTWKQAIIPKARVIHDRSWLGRMPKYERLRLDGLSWRRSYKYIRAKWNLRLDMLSHIMYELVYPALTITRSQRVMSTFNSFMLMRKLKTGEMASRTNSN
jgi:GT2 family glycosyltransferase